MHYIKQSVVYAWGCFDYHLTPRFHDYNDNTNQTVVEKIKDVAANAFVTIAGVVSFLAFPQLTLVGFVFGHFFRYPIREGVSELWQTYWKVNTVSKVILGIVAFCSWPYLYLAVPSLIGCYIGWQALDRSSNDNYFFYPPPAPA